MSDSIYGDETIEIPLELFYECMELARLAPIYIDRERAEAEGVKPHKWYEQYLLEEAAERAILTFRKLLHVGNDKLMDGSLDLPPLSE